MPDQTLAKAVEVYLARQSRRAHPDGQFDKAQRWTPSNEERCSCCSEVRQPTRGYPYTLMKHCRSVGHVANLHGVDEKALRRAALNRSRELKFLKDVQ